MEKKECDCLECKIERKIVEIEFTQLSYTTTVCLITLENGMEFVGKSFCPDIELYEEAISNAESFEDAKSQILVTFKYLEKQKELKKFKKELRKSQQIQDGLY